MKRIIKSMISDPEIEFISIYNLQPLKIFNSCEYDKLSMLRDITHKINPREFLDLKYLDMFIESDHDFRADAVKILGGKIINFYDHCEKLQDSRSTRILLKHVALKSNKIRLEYSYIYTLIERMANLTCYKAKKLDKLIYRKVGYHLFYESGDLIDKIPFLYNIEKDVRLMKLEEEYELLQIKTLHVPFLHPEMKKMIEKNEEIEVLLRCSKNLRYPAETESIYIADYDDLFKTELLNEEERIQKFKEIEGKSEAEELNLCVICYDNNRSNVFLPCRHMCTCSTCSEKLKICPICRADIIQNIQVIFS